MIEAKLCAPHMDKNWSLQFTGLSKKDRSEDPFKASIWFWAQHFGSHYGSKPFLQGDSEDWMMIEFWCSSQSLILETCEAVCKQAGVDLQFD